MRFYPWWEHPSFQAAVQEGKSWAFEDTIAGRITVTVFARGVEDCRLSSRREVTDWEFIEEAPLLWPYHDSAQIFCTSPLTRDQVAGVIDLVRSAAGDAVDPYQFLNVPRDSRLFYGWAAQGSFSLGVFPQPLFGRVTAWLDGIDARYYIPRRPEIRTNLPKALLIDGEDYIIANDFELDVPPIVHKAEWFRP